MRGRHRRRDRLVRAAQHGVDAREQLGERERLGDVVVGAEPQRGDLVELALARRQHDHRHEVVGRAQRGEHLEAVLLRQVDVEQDEREVLVARSSSSASSPSRAIDGRAAGELEVQREAGRDRVVVLDDQDAAGHDVARSGTAVGSARAPRAGASAGCGTPCRPGAT